MVIVGGFKNTGVDFLTPAKRMNSSRLVRFCGRTYCLPADCHYEKYLKDQFNLSPFDYWTTTNDSNDLVQVRLRLVGGKGGFGSQLRAQGNRMSSKKRAGNYEACRDLSGRRIRTVNQAKLINEYLQRKPELEAKKEQEIREKMEKAIRAPDQKIIFEDVDFLQTTRRVADEVELAVMEAIYGTDDLDEIDPDGKLPVRNS